MANKYHIYDASQHVRNGCVADHFEIVGEYIIFYSNYDIRKTEMVIKLGEGWSIVKEE